MPNHFVQYHKLAHAPLPTEFTVRTRRPGAVREGDIVWLLAGESTRGKHRYSFSFWFVVDVLEATSDGEMRLRGRHGARFDPPWTMGEDDEWFNDFFKRDLGNGAFGFMAVPARLLREFEDRRRQSNVIEGPGGVGSDPPPTGDPPEGVDERQWQSILTRRGQSRFRAALLEAYGGRCAVSESKVQPLLEAAHILPHSEGGEYKLSNGILLRADIHTLFDLHLLGVDAALRVHLDDGLRNSEFSRFHHKRIETLPSSTTLQPSPTALQDRFEKFLAGRSTT